MKFSESWLREFVDPKISTHDLCNKLTLAGLEVDSIQPVAGDFFKVVVGEIVNIRKHHNADKLNICLVDIGTDENVTIVCGATNIYVGMKAPVALIGAKLPGGWLIKKSKLRGEVSYGMMCSETELGLSEESNGLMVLPKLSEPGRCVRELLGLDDSIIDVDLTPNRADCLSVYGIAREVSALTGANLLNNEKVKKVDLGHKEIIPTRIDAGSSCKHYMARIIKNIDSSIESPLWLREKLRRSGVRSISLVIDVTNFVMLELGQPMHAFDLSCIENEIIVRNAREGERLILLNNSEITLNESDLVIADSEKALALAGIMGGAKSSVSNQTTNILLESAFFVPVKISGKARKHGLHTDSSHRFERGVDPMLTCNAMERATRLLIDIAGGIAGPISETGSIENSSNLIIFRSNRVNTMLGYTFEDDYIESIFRSLGFYVERKGEGEWYVRPPTYRFDIAIEEDLVEEIARVFGYENLPSTLPTQKMNYRGMLDFELTLSIAKNIMVQRGYYEVINYSFIDPKLSGIFSGEGALALQNPISTDMSVMRSTLLPGLMAAFKSNLNRQQDRIRIFEEGVVFTKYNNNFIESVRFSGLVFGNVAPLSWRDSIMSDFFSVKSDIECLLNETNCKISWKELTNCEYMHPGRSASIFIDDELVGLCGVVHPNVMKLMNIKGSSPIVFELDWSKIPKRRVPEFTNLSKYPSISRDLALIVCKSCPSSKLLDLIKEEGGDLLKEIRVFDIYEGEKLEINKKSIAINLILQDSSQTLKEDDINFAIASILKKLKEKAGAELRE